MKKQVKNWWACRPAALGLALLLGLLLLGRSAAAQRHAASAPRPEQGHLAAPNPVAEADSVDEEEEMEEDSVEVAAPAVAATAPAAAPAAAALAVAPAPVAPAAPAVPLTPAAPLVPAAPTSAGAGSAPAAPQRPAGDFQQIQNALMLNDFQVLRLQQALAAPPAEDAARQRLWAALSEVQRGRLRAWEAGHPAAPRLAVPAGD